VHTYLYVTFYGNYGCHNTTYRQNNAFAKR
jgi:hypothetical protein